VPADLEIDTWEGAGWVSSVAFRLERVRPRWLPSFRPVSNFPELNLRTYVLYHGEPAIYFLSIQAGKRLVVPLTRWLTPLPYVFARMNHVCREGGFSFHSRRPTAGPRDLRFTAQFTPLPGKREARPGSHDAWLLERYCLYVDDAHGTLFRTVVWHKPWEVQGVTAKVAAHSLGRPFGLNLSPEPDKSHFSSGVRALVWPFAAVERGTSAGPR
jgi:uncharacterized protein YqjF (DUF2071 family)